MAIVWSVTILIYAVVVYFLFFSKSGRKTDMTERSLILLNETGDIEITWDTEHDDAMRGVIAKKMQEGVRFFVLKPIFGSSFYQKKQLKTLKDLKEQRIKIGDADLEAMFSAGKIAMFRSPQGQTIETDKIAKTPDEAIQNRTVGVRPLRGG